MYCMPLGSRPCRHLFTRYAVERGYTVLLLLVPYTFTTVHSEMLGGDPSCGRILVGKSREIDVTFDNSIGLMGYELVEFVFATLTNIPEAVARP